VTGSTFTAAEGILQPHQSGRPELEGVMNHRSSGTPWELETLPAREKGEASVLGWAAMATAQLLLPDLATP
jgi:hypothetical protein